MQVTLEKSCGDSVGSSSISARPANTQSLKEEGRREERGHGRSSKPETDTSKRRRISKKKRMNKVWLILLAMAAAAAAAARAGGGFILWWSIWTWDVARGPPFMMTVKEDEGVHSTPPAAASQLLGLVCSPPKGFESIVVVNGSNSTIISFTSHDLIRMWISKTVINKNKLVHTKWIEVCGARKNKLGECTQLWCCVLFRGSLWVILSFIDQDMNGGHGVTTTEDATFL
ncbi:hypothetical protein B296_00045151 [Ensete ventricosum]|uniref:Uncharacterized protein n=1 Tax=Ensete ventricosum TaxID=4639 RepID=A0A426YWJ9_ENSVE|nr:hypothetical protein B296_00045151 [Ensete ventricosum]